MPVKYEFVRLAAGNFAKTRIAENGKRSSPMPVSPANLEGEIKEVLGPNSTEKQFDEALEKLASEGSVTLVDALESIPATTSPDALSRKCKECGYIGFVGDHCPKGHGELTEAV